MPKKQPSSTIHSRIIATVAGQTAQDVNSEGAVEIQTGKSRPTYSALLPKYKVIAEETATCDGLTVQIRIKAYPPENYLVEAAVEVANVFTLEVDSLRDKLIQIAEKRLRQLDVLDGFKEEYTIFAISGYRGEPQQFLKYEREIVGLIRSENLPLSQTEISETIRNSSLQYTAHDLTILDWDGAFCFDPTGDWHETIDLLEVANVHLLRLRILDHDLDQRLENMTSLLQMISKRRLSSGKIKKQMAGLMSLQVRSIEEFSHSGRDIQLIGDWYAAKLYNLISRKFHLTEWRSSLRGELNNLRDLYQTAADHFGVSTQTRVEFIEITLWLLLAVGYIGIFFLDFKKAIGG